MGTKTKKAPCGNDEEKPQGVRKGVRKAPGPSKPKRKKYG
jgi:hypothetical protein